METTLPLPRPTVAGLRALVSDVLGVPATRIPVSWTFPCSDAEIAQAVTLRNAVALYLARSVSGGLCFGAPPWHAQYEGRIGQMLDQLVIDGYLVRERSPAPAA